MKMAKNTLIPALSAKLALPFLLGIWLLFVGFELGKAYHIPMWRDDATFAEAAKNLVQGNGYSIVSFDRVSLFNNGISSGPVVVLPTALMIKLFGNTYWVPGVTNIIIINTLLMVAFCQLKNLIPTHVLRWQCAGLFLLFCLLMTNHYTGFPGEQMHVWHALMGDVPGALLIIIATLYIAQSRYDPKTIFIGAILAGLAGLCKMQAMLAVASLGIYLTAHYLATHKEKHLSWRHISTNLFLYGTGGFLPLLLFEIVKIVGTGGWHEYLGSATHLKATMHEFDAVAHLPDIAEKIYILGEYLGIIHAPLKGIFMYVGVLGMITLALLYILYASTHHLIKCVSVIASPAQWASDALLLCCILYFLWWIFICSLILPRYAISGLLYGFAAVALAVTNISLNNTYKGNKIFLIIIVAVMFLRYDAVAFLWTATQYDTSLIEQQEVLHKLTEIKQKSSNTIIFSCGSTVEMEYLLPTAANFIECERLEDPQFIKNTKILLSFTIDNTGQVLYYKPDHFGADARDNLDIAVRHCPAPDIYAGRNYFINSCPIP